MAGNGASPINSSWLSTNEAGLGASLLYGRINFGDNNTDEETLWDTWLFGAASTSITGTFATTEAADTASFNGSVVVNGTLSSTEAIDVAAFNGTVVVSGTFATTEATDAAAFAGNTSSGISGSLITTEATDTAAFVGSVVVSGTFSTTEATDTSAFSGSTSLSFSFAITEAPDTADFEQFLSGGGKAWRWKEGYNATVKPKVATTPNASNSDAIRKAAAVLSKLGGDARAKSLTATQRSNIATKAAKARWR